jgi:hypothetical protein
VVFLAESNTTLVENTVVKSDILTLSLRSYLYHLKRTETDAVSLSECHNIGNEHGSRGAQSADRQAALQQTVDAMGEFETLTQCVLGATGIVAPGVFPYLCTTHKVDVHLTLEGEAFEVYLSILTYVEPQVNTFVDSEACDQSVLVVNVSADGANPIRTENMILVLIHEEG